MALHREGARTLTFENAWQRVAGVLGGGARVGRDGVCEAETQTLGVRLDSVEAGIVARYL